MTLGNMVLITPTTDISFADVRCNSCGRLVYKVNHEARAIISIKCPRCGSIDTVLLSS